MEYIHGTLIYLASQPQRVQEVKDVISNWGAKHAQYDGAPTVDPVPPGKYDPVNPSMIVHIWFGNNVVTDRAEANNAWAAIMARPLGWVQPGSLIQQGTDSTDPTTILNTRSF